MSTPKNVTFASLLKRLRRAAALTQEELAERAGLSVNAVSALERGVNHAPRRDTVGLLADALQLGAPERALFEAAARGRGAGTAAAPAAPNAPSSTDLERATAVGLPPLVGRERELALLRRHLDPCEPAADAFPPLLLFAGEPGIGKSRLLAEASQLATSIGWTVLFGRCHRRGGQEPYEPLLGALGGFIRREPLARVREALEECSWLTRLLPELAESALIAPPRWSLAADQERRLMFAAVRRFLERIAGPAGTLLLLDDLQWAGADALDLLAALARAPGETRLCVLGAYRSTELGREGPLAMLLADLAREGIAGQAEVARLSADEACDLLRRLLPGSADAQGETARTTQTTEAQMGPDAAPLSPEAERVLRQAAGVPFFMVSYVQALGLDADSSADAAARTTGPTVGGQNGPPSRAPVAGVPWEVAQSIRVRMAVLPTAAQDMLSVAAVAGREVPRRVLLWAARSSGGGTAALEALEAACLAGLLVESSEHSYAFGHDLIRDVALADLGAARRELLHRRVAEALESQPGELPVERLAFHYGRAGLSEKAITYLARAGDKAEAAHAYTVAAEYYRELVERLDAAGRADEAARARERLGLALRSLGRNDEALVCFEQALRTYRERGELERLAWAVAQIGWAHVARGATQDGLDRLQAMLHIFEEFEHTYGLALLHTALGDLLYAAGRYEQQRTAAQRAAHLARAAGDEQLLAQAEQLRGRALLMLGPLDEGLRVMQDAVRLAEARDDLSNLCLALCMASLGYWMQGQFDKERECVERAVEVARRVGDPAQLALAVSGVGMVAWYRGEWEEAHRTLDEAHAGIRHVEAGLVLPYVAGVLGAIELVTGRPELGAEHLELAVRVAERIGDLLPQRFAQAALAEDDLVHGRAARARERLLPMLDRDSQHETFAAPLLSLLAWAELELGEHEQAQTRIAEALSWAREEKLDLALVDVLRVQALVAIRREQWSDAERALDEAIALARAMPYPYAEAKALYVTGLLHVARHEPEQARERFAAALAICGRLGERPYADCIERAPKEHTA